ncbi:MAG TPA: FtsX-like permease family protein [Cyclobacteriaceae bacterium]|jgi:ABC-type lipoprotein release transport system permease subunit|nr:FtsX-like permease family protein [Cyclobacteriaceae bacterium]
MLTKIAWRNVWRHKARSGVVIGSIVVGIWALAFGGGFMQSFMIGYIQQSIRHETSNGQIHHPDFSKDQDITFTIHDVEKIVRYLKQQKEVKSICERSIVNGMISSSRQATGVKIVGVDPAEESEVTQLDSLIAAGEYFDHVLHPVLIGEKLAEKLKVKVKSKVVLTFQDAHGNIAAGQFRVAGILHAASLVINETSAFVEREHLNELLGIPEAVHEIAFTTNAGTDDKVFADQLTKAFPNEKTEYWGDLSPTLVFMQQWMGATLKILIVIIMTALAFGIINTMLMAVLERVRELGVLMALGMKRSRVFFMIMLETIFLSTVGGPLGLLVGYATISYLGDKGIDLSDYSKGLEAIGYENILYPRLGAQDYLQIVAGVLITALLASIYPAWKAIQYDPVEAIHSL